MRKSPLRPTSFYPRTKTSTVLIEVPVLFFCKEGVTEFVWFQEFRSHPLYFYKLNQLRLMNVGNYFSILSSLFRPRQRLVGHIVTLMTTLCTLVTILNLLLAARLCPCKSLAGRFLIQKFQIYNIPILSNTNHYSHPHCYGKLDWQWKLCIFS